MSSPVLISVVIPAHNAARYIERTVQSVLDQRRPDGVDIEVVVIDDGSTDDTGQIAAGLARSALAVTVTTQPNAGVCAARNAGLARARGHYVMFLDADDLLLPWSVARLLAAMVTEPDGIMAFGAVLRIDEQDRVTRRPVVAWSHDDSIEAWLEGNPVRSGSGALIRAGVARSVGGFDESMRGDEGEALADWLYYLGLRLEGPTIRLNEPTVAYREGATSMSSDSGAMVRSQIRFYQRVVDRYPDLAPGVTERLVNRAMAAHGAYHLSANLVERRWSAAARTMAELGPGHGGRALIGLVRSRQSMLNWRRLSRRLIGRLRLRSPEPGQDYPVPLAAYLSRHRPDLARPQSDRPDLPAIGDNGGVRFSVCIPSFDRVDKLRALLASLAADPALVAAPVEVVVGLDGSTDGSAEMLTALADDYPVPLRWTWHPNRGRSATRNVLIDAAVGDIIWFLDDDMVVETGTFARHAAWDRNRSDVMFGPCHVVGANEGLALFYEYRYRDLAGRDTVDRPDVVSYANTTIPAAVLRRHRFDESFVGYGFEDYELALRMLEGGVRFGFDSATPVHHHNDKSGFEMLADIRDEGMNRVHLARLHPERGSFALDLRPGRLAGLLRPVAERGWSRPLWYLAHGARAVALPFSGDRSFRMIRIADDLALYSGLALAWNDQHQPELWDCYDP